MRRKKIKFGRIIVVLFFIIGIIFLMTKIVFKDKKKGTDNIILVMSELVNKDENELGKYTETLVINKEYKNSESIEKGKIISQSIENGTKFEKGDTLMVVISKGPFDKDKLKSDGINELGHVPIMMYHGIENISDNKYVGGNIDKDGYNRTSNAFREDLEMYYEKGYRMIRLNDYVNGNINTEYGKSPLILTFDDGKANNLMVTGLDDSGNIIIDPNSAVGILEEFKEKYKDYNVTATFFVNGGLFEQEEYNDKILNWLVDNGYDVGNHTYGHINIGNSTSDNVQSNIGKIYESLDTIIPNKYVHIIALPFGSPLNKNHANYKYVLNSTYNGNSYITEAALRVGWEPEVSPYDTTFDKTYLKRCRAYDNNGKSFDISSVFSNLEYNKYISDGDSETIVIPEINKDNLSETEKEVIYY